MNGPVPPVIATVAVAFASPKQFGIANAETDALIPPEFGTFIEEESVQPFASFTTTPYTPADKLLIAFVPDTPFDQE